MSWWLWFTSFSSGRGWFLFHQSTELSSTTLPIQLCVILCTAALGFLFLRFTGGCISWWNLWGCDHEVSSWSPTRKHVHLHPAEYSLLAVQPWRGLSSPCKWISVYLQQDLCFSADEATCLILVSPGCGLWQSNYLWHPFDRCFLFIFIFIIIFLTHRHLFTLLLLRQFHLNLNGKGQLLIIWPLVHKHTYLPKKHLAARTHYFCLCSIKRALCLKEALDIEKVWFRFFRESPRIKHVPQHMKGITLLNINCCAVFFFSFFPSHVP